MRAHLYAIGVENHFQQFGYSSNLPRRFAEIQVGCPIDIAILAAMPVGSQVIARDLERLLHRAMNADILRGDWFRSTPRTRKVIDALKTSDTAAFRLRLITWLKAELTATTREIGGSALQGFGGLFSLDVIGRNGAPKRLDFGLPFERKLALSGAGPETAPKSRILKG